MFEFLKRKPEPRIPAVIIDEVGVRRDLGDGEIEDVAWKDLEEVQIVTTDEGPFAEDVFYLLVGPNGTGCCVPQGSSQSAALLRRLQELPDFDNDAVIRAMGCSENGRFVCWKKKP
jgi:hypothetical protein